MPKETKKATENKETGKAKKSKATEEKKETKKTKTTKTTAEPKKKSTAGRDANGRFLPGQSGNPKGRPTLPEDFKKYAELAPAQLYELAMSEDVGNGLRASIFEWFCEMYYGKARQQVDVDAEQSINSKDGFTIKFEGELEEWSK